MPLVTIDGVEYAPLSGRANIGIAIKTHNRPNELARALEEHKKFLPDGAVLWVIDDGSDVPAIVPDWAQLFRFEESQGIVAAGNKSLELLMNSGCLDLFLWDDDAWPAADNWWKPYVESSEAHLAYQFLDLSGANKLNDITILHRDKQHVSYSGQRGVMLYYKRHAIERVGGFDWQYNRGMYEHSDLANRIYHAGLTSWRYADVANSHQLIYSLDEHELVKRSVPQQERIDAASRNASIHNRRRDLGEYPDFVPLTRPRNVVMTCLYGKSDDPQRPGARMTLKDLEILKKSVRGANFICYTDLDAEGDGYIASELSINVFFQRWLNVYQYLRDNPDVEWVAAVDGTDVEMLREPWGELERGKLYVGYEPDVVSKQWMIDNHGSGVVQDFIKKHPHAQLLNAGVALGDRETVMRFAREMSQYFFDSQIAMFLGQKPSTHDLGDMGAFNVIARRFAHIWGSQVTTVFNQNEKASPAWWRHK